MGLELRYPELSFIMQVSDFEDKEVTWARADELSLQIPASAQVVFVYGFSPHMGLLFDWVEENFDRDLVFIEDDLAVVARIGQGENGKCFKNERIHLRLVMQDESLESFADALVRDFPFESIAFVNLKSDKEVFHHLRLQLTRKSVVESAVAAELLHAHKLFSHLKKNFSHFCAASDVGLWKDRLKGIPAVICGAGPSLTSAREQIKKFEGRGVIFAAGSAITALSSYQIVPNLLFAIDPNQEEFARLALHTAFDVPLIYGCRLHPEVMQAHVGDLAYLVSGTGGAVETWIEEQLGIIDRGVLEGLSEEALSVTAVAIKSAIYFGCNPIIFAGIDLSFSQEGRYANGVISNLQCALEENSEKTSDALLKVDGKLTMAKWVMERDVIQNLIEKNPQVTFLDGSGKGLRFSAIEVCSDWASDRYPSKDIPGILHHLTQTTRLKIHQAQIEEQLRVLKRSFLRCHEIISEILFELETLFADGETRDETPKEAVLEMDLEEEIAYQLVLQGAAYAWTFPIKKIAQKEKCERPLVFIKSRLYRKLQIMIEETLKNYE